MELYLIMSDQQPSWLWQEHSFGPSDYLGDLQEVIEKHQFPWECFECSLRFKWDMQLLRHQRATGHQNPNREMRKQQRYQKGSLSSIKRCNYCSSLFQNSEERLKHKRWCPKDPRTQKSRKSYKSSLPNYLYECHCHEIPYYFSNLLNLQNHIKTHRQFKPGKIQQIMEIFRWKKKWNYAGLTNEEYRNISEKFSMKISVTTLRKMFKKA